MLLNAMAPCFAAGPLFVTPFEGHSRKKIIVPYEQKKINPRLNLKIGGNKSFIVVFYREMGYL